MLPVEFLWVYKYRNQLIFFAIVDIEDNNAEKFTHIKGRLLDQAMFWLLLCCCYFYL